ncbi:hypothetical protein, partial [Nocardiopsis tropica]|uniref:hypothetical protein n=1 Tax=Nocardiopsis tropica TaxID=109330 RepID=UPI0031DE331A
PSGATEDRNPDHAVRPPRRTTWRSPSGATEDRNQFPDARHQCGHVWRSPSGATEDLGTTAYQMTVVPRRTWCGWRWRP